MKSSAVRTIVFAVVILLFIVIIGVYETLKQHQAAEQSIQKIPILKSNKQDPGSSRLTSHHSAYIQTENSHKEDLSKAISSLRAGQSRLAVESSQQEDIIESSSPRKRIAYAITITKDGFFQDGAAVLVYSILKSSVNSPYDISFVAFVHPNVTLARDGLTKIGFHVIEVPIPINTSAIKYDFLREKINKNGCCGASEMIKLSSYRYALQLGPDDHCS